MTGFFCNPMTTYTAEEQSTTYVLCQREAPVGFDNAVTYQFSVVGRDTVFGRNRGAGEREIIQRAL